MSITYGGSSKPAVMSVVTPADSATGTSLGVMRCTWLSIAAAVAMSPYPFTGHVFGPIVSSTPSVMSGLPARPIPTIRPSLIPMFVFTTPRNGSTTTTPAISMSSSLSEVARSNCAIRDRKFFAYPQIGSSP